MAGVVAAGATVGGLPYLLSFPAAWGRPAGVIASLTPSTDFSGRVAIVTGAARGLGRAAAQRLHERGASVVVNVRDAERATALAGSLGERALAVPGDITGEGVPDEIVRRTLD